LYRLTSGEALRAWLKARPGDEEDHVFRSITSQAPLTDSGVRQLLRRRGEKAGVTGRINSHSFRHGFARQYLLNGGDLGTLSDLMGHTDVKVTKDFYAVYSTEELSRKHERHSPITHLLDDETGQAKDT